MFSTRRVTRSKSAARRSYNRLSRGYDWLAGGSERPFRWRGLAMLAPKPGERLLEIGCGTGEAWLAMAQAVGPTGLACGVDLSEGMLSVASRRKRLAASPSQAQLCQADGASLPLASASLDGIFISFTLELFDTPEIPPLLAECSRLLQPEGRLALVTLARPEPSGAAVRLYEWFHDCLPELVDCRPIAAQPLLSQAGFSIAANDCRSMWGLPVEILLARPVPTK